MPPHYKLLHTHTYTRYRSLAMRCVGVCPLLPMGAESLLPAVEASVRLLADPAPAVKEEAAKV